MLRRALDGLYLGAGYAAGVFLFAIFAIMMVMSVGRQFSLNIPAGDDFASWCMAAMAFLGLAHTFKRGEMIRVGLLLERLHGRKKQIAEIVALGIATAFVIYFTRHAVQMTYDSWRWPGPRACRWVPCLPPRPGAQARPGRWRHCHCSSGWARFSSAQSCRKKCFAAFRPGCNGCPGG